MLATDTPTRADDTKPRHERSSLPSTLESLVAAGSAAAEPRNHDRYIRSEFRTWLALTVLEDVRPSASFDDC